MRRILLVGVSSRLGTAVAKELVGAGDSLFIAGRDETRLLAIARELGGSAKPLPTGRFHAEEFALHDRLLDDATARLGGLDGVVYCAGGHGSTGHTAADFEGALAVLHANFTGAWSLLGRFASRQAEGSHAFVAAVSSILAEVPAAEDFVYSSAKEALNRFLANLARCEPPRVRAVTIVLGNLDTAAKRSRGLFPAATPEAAARGIRRCLDSRRGVVYLPGFWRWVMLATRCVPASLLRRLSRKKGPRGG